jgi:putative transposase
MKQAFDASGKAHGSPRLRQDLVDPLPPADPAAPPVTPRRVSVNTVADSMRRQGLVARTCRRPKGLTRQDKTAPKFPDLLKRDFTAAGPNQGWVGDMTEIPTVEGKLYLPTVPDLCSRRLLAAPTSEHPNAQLACDAIRMTVTVRGGADHITGGIFHTARGPTYTAGDFTRLCSGLAIRQGMAVPGHASTGPASKYTTLL